MAESRLSLALDQGLFTLAGAGGSDPIVVFGATGRSDLSALPRERVIAVTTIRTDHDALAAQGYRVATGAPEAAALAVVILPRARAAARGLIAAAADLSAGPVVVDGQKTDGIEGILRELRKRGAVSEALSKHHGKLAVLAPGADLADWAGTGVRRVAGGFVTRDGIFSADGPDPGSVLLARALPADLSGRVADLGAGWGFLSRAALDRPKVKELHLVEADLAALDCARENVTDARARFHWADATTFADPEGFDAILTNPPFHTGRTGDPDLGRAFIGAAARLLRRHGQLWLVANRHLPYERTLSERFGTVMEIGGDGSYKLYRAARPAKSKG